MPRKTFWITPQGLNQYLTTVSAIAAILLVDGSEQAAVGKLSPDGFQDAIEAIRRHWNNPRLGDLNRIVGLFIDSQFYFLFAKCLPDGKDILGLLFPNQTPLVRLRQDMTNFMRSLIERTLESGSSDWTLERSLQFEEQNTTVAAKDFQIERPLPGRKLKITNVLEKQEETSMAGNQIPSTKPDLPSQSSGSWEYISKGNPNWIGGMESSWQPLNEVPRQEDDLVSILQEKYELRGEPKSEVDVQVDPALAKSQPEQKSAQVLAEEDTRPFRVQPAMDTWEVVESDEPVSDVTFYLAPRQDNHYLIGHLSRQLRRWLPDLCQTYGWELGALSVRPDYIKWTLQDFPERLIQEMLQIVRKKTSIWIFRVFPNMKESVISPDFWAPGYLVDTHKRDYSTRALLARVAKNRLVD
jgi:REP element-mobilizing transposase RayT